MQWVYLVLQIIKWCIYKTRVHHSWIKSGKLAHKLFIHTC